GGVALGRTWTAGSADLTDTVVFTGSGTMPQGARPLQSVSPHALMQEELLGTGFGTAILAYPDTNFDGIDEIWISEPGYNGGFGRIHVYNGDQFVTTIDTPFASPTSFGHSMARMGDLTGDGFPEILVSGPNFG